MPEWLKGADCKSAGLSYVGSNPTRPTFVLTLGPYAMPGKFSTIAFLKGILYGSKRFGNMCANNVMLLICRTFLHLGLVRFEPTNGTVKLRL